MNINVFLCLAIPVFVGQVISARYSYTLRPNDDSKCGCNYTEIYSNLPSFMNSISRDESFSWVFKGRDGERGLEGPMGPTGLPGRNGRDGEKGEPGLPGESSYRRIAEKGEPGIPGRSGLKGSKGERGTPFTTVLRQGSYIEVKGEKGESGRRGRRGMNGEPGAKGERGISIQGEKGAKGEPVSLSDLEMLKGSKGERGLVGMPGACCGRMGPRSNLRADGSVLVPLPGPQGVKGEKGGEGPPGSPPEFTMVPGASVFKTEADMRLVRSRPGTLCFVEEDERAFFRVKNGWKEIPLGNLRLDRPDQSQAYSVAESQPLDPTHRHYVNDVAEKPYYNEKIRNSNYLKRYRHGRGQV
ncbi:Collagen-like protein 3 [Folsomia candida]|uniref:Collagen-like protein 3 n=2 Tax=Folsomia candida TaxID=158441 RepID=A0A226F4T6_FOLCA|nr:Collagen-like protein 3 [Folsomia candida]